MSCDARTAIAGLVLLLGMMATPVFAQTSDLTNNKIGFAYIAPKTEKYIPIMERLKKRRVLEQLSEFVSPLRLPHQFSLVTAECGEANAYYDRSQWSLTLCYELIEDIDRIAPEAGQTKDGFTRDEVVMGETIFVLLHELGHAAFDMLHVPVFGREEDAADQMAIFIPLQFNPRVARTVSRGDFFFFKNQGDPSQWSHFADEHGTSSQRLYNGICWTYGGNPQLIKDVIDAGWLPKERAATCAHEYQLIKTAFIKTVWPFIDEKLMKKVQTRDWLQAPSER
jgi:hypothetical protein